MRWTRAVRQWLVAALALFFACAADPPSRDPSTEVATSSSEAELKQLLSSHFQREDYEGAAKLLEELVARFPKKQYWLQLSLVYATIGKDEEALAALDVAYGEGYLTKSRELVRLAHMYLFHEIPFKAAQVLEKGFADGQIDETKENYELLANSLIRAQRLDQALDPLERAAELSQSGDVYLRLGRILIAQESWRMAESVLNKAIDKGDLDRPDVAHHLLAIAKFRGRGRERPARPNYGDFWLPGEFERALREREEQL